MITEIPSGNALEIEPQDALAAMLEIERCMIRATRKMMELNRRLPYTNVKARPAIQAQLEELIAVIAAYLEQVEYLRERYRAGF